MENPTREYYQSEGELLNFLQFTYCIKCGSCMAACPTMATDKEYLGPMPLTQAHRYNTDTRDDGLNLRKYKVGGAHGAFRCHYAGECSNVCPKGVDPARAIQILKRTLVLDYLKLLKTKAPCKIVEKPAMQSDHKTPKAPEFTI
ncbi:MAG: 4Fe-4S dicluster domain-containing protein [bacterium]